MISMQSEGIVVEAQHRILFPWRWTDWIQACTGGGWGTREAAHPQGNEGHLEAVGTSSFQLSYPVLAIGCRARLMQLCLLYSPSIRCPNWTRKEGAAWCAAHLMRWSNDIDMVELHGKSGGQIPGERCVLSASSLSASNISVRGSLFSIFKNKKSYLSTTLSRPCARIYIISLISWEKIRFVNEWCRSSAQRSFHVSQCSDRRNRSHLEHANSCSCLGKFEFRERWSCRAPFLEASVPYRTDKITQFHWVTTNGNDRTRGIKVVEAKERASASL